MSQKQSPITPEEQHQISMKVACSFCGQPAGEKCKPGLIFPQYPHTPRLQDGMVADGWTRQEVEDLYKF